MQQKLGFEKSCAASYLDCTYDILARWWYDIFFFEHSLNDMIYYLCLNGPNDILARWWYDTTGLMVLFRWACLIFTWNWQKQSETEVLWTILGETVELLTACILTNQNCRTELNINENILVYEGKWFQNDGLCFMF